MKAAKRPATPDDLRGELHLLKESLARMEAYIQEPMNGIESIQAAGDAHVDASAFLIARTVFLGRDKEHLKWRSESPTASALQRKFWEKIGSVDPLWQQDKDRILKAVLEFDIPFLESLIEAMQLCISRQGFANPAKVRVILCHRTYCRMNGAPPTARQLLEFVLEMAPNSQMDRKTLTYHCNAEKMPLARAKAGRPAKRRK